VIRRPIFPVFLSHGGCRRRCVYCRQEIHVGGSQSWTPAKVARTLEEKLPRGGDVEIAYYGGSFTLLPAPLQRDYLEVASDFVARGMACGIRFSTHPAGLGEEHLSSLPGVPVRTVEVGCQSFSEAVLKASNRGHDAGQIRSGIERLRELSVDIGLQLMPGLPGGDTAEALASLEEALALDPDFVRIYPTVVLPGTQLETMMHDGKYRPWELEKTVETCADMLLRCLSAGVPVVRIGLPPLDVPAVAGPWHPALGQLVVSRLWRRALMAALRRGHGEVLVARRCLSDALGHGRQNLSALSRVFGALSIRGGDIDDPDTFRVGDTTFSWRKMIAADRSDEVFHAN